MFRRISDQTCQTDRKEIQAKRIHDLVNMELRREREQCSKIPQVRSINAIDEDILAVSQCLVFVVMDFESFSKMFKGALQEIKD